MMLPLQRMVALLSLGGMLLPHAVAAAENSTAFPHPMTLAAISPGPNRVFIAGEPMPIVFAFTHASAALHAYGPGSFTWAIVRANASNTEDDIANGSFEFPAGADTLSGSMNSTTKDHLRHAYGDTFYYAVSFGGSDGLNEEVVFNNELLPGDYKISWNWNYQLPCPHSSLDTANNDGWYDFLVYDGTSNQTTPGGLLVFNEACALPVHRFGIEGAEEEDTCANFMEKGSNALYGFEDGDEGCGMRLSDDVLFCLGAILDSDDENEVCQRAEFEKDFEQTRRALDGYDMGEDYPLFEEDRSAASSTNNGTESGSQADPTSTADNADESTPAASAGVSFAASWTALALVLISVAVVICQ